MDVERLPLEFHDDGLLYCFDSDELYTGVWKKSLAGVIVEEGFYSDGLADGKWIYRNQDNSIKSTELYEDGFRISWSSPDTNGQLSVGATVKHAKFGLGTVLNFEGNEEHKIENHEKPDNEHKIKNHEKPEWIKTIQQKNEDDISNAQEANSKRKEEFERDYQPLLYLNNSFQDLNVELKNPDSELSFPTYKLMDIEFEGNGIYQYEQTDHDGYQPLSLIDFSHTGLSILLLKTNVLAPNMPRINIREGGPLSRYSRIFWKDHETREWKDHETSEERCVIIIHKAEGFYFYFRIRTTQRKYRMIAEYHDFRTPITYIGAYDDYVSTQFGTDESILSMSIDKFYDVYKWVSYNTDEIPPQIGSEIDGLIVDDIYKGNKEGLDWVERRRLKVIMLLFFLLFLAVVVFN